MKKCYIVMTFNQGYLEAYPRVFKSLKKAKKHFNSEVSKYLNENSSEQIKDKAYIENQFYDETGDLEIIIREGRKGIDKT